MVDSLNSDAHHGLWTPQKTNEVRQTIPFWQTYAAVPSDFTPLLLEYHGQNHALYILNAYSPSSIPDYIATSGF